MSSSFDRQMQRRAAVAGRLVEAFVLAPIGAGVKLIADGPGVVARTRQELSNARFIGEMVVAQGTAQLKERLATDAASRPVAVVDEIPVEHVEPAVVEPAVDESAVGDSTVVESTAAEPDAAIDAEDLGIPDYDSLPAIDIVGQLESLSAAELHAVEAYERANRRRRTVLGKVAQLSGTA